MRRSNAGLLLAAILPHLLDLAPIALVSDAKPRRARPRAQPATQPTRAQRGEIADWNAAVEAKRQAKLARRKSARASQKKTCRP